MIGIDEAGRGSLIGEVYACACFSRTQDLHLLNLKDSKKLSSNQRNKIYESIQGVDNIKYAIGTASIYEIETLNILKATMLAMERAFLSLNIKDAEILIDGNQKPASLENAKCIIRGDETVAQISLASIIAKVERDKKMVDIGVLYPNYGIEIHKGYGTKKHIEALILYGPTSLHRKSFLKNIAF
jgi:ribonuclease HII